jgi:hypothetical protein
MYHRIALPHSPDEYDARMTRWQWFRRQLRALHDMGDLPETFSPDEGEVSVIERVDEDDPRYDLYAPEYNYDSRDQTLTFGRAPWWLTIQFYECTLGDHYSLTLEQPGRPESKVRLFGARHAVYLELDDSSPDFAFWKNAAAELAPLLCATHEQGYQERSRAGQSPQEQPTSQVAPALIPGLGRAITTHGLPASEAPGPIGEALLGIPPRCVAGDCAQRRAEGHALCQEHLKDLR